MMKFPVACGASRHRPPRMSPSQIQLCSRGDGGHGNAVSLEYFSLFLSFARSANEYANHLSRLCTSLRRAPIPDWGKSQSERGVDGLQHALAATPTAAPH